MRVVEVEGVALGAVGERGQQRARPAAPAHDRGLRLTPGGGDHRVERAGERLGRAADGRADPVGEGQGRGLDHRGGERSELEPEHEVDQRVRDRRACVLHGMITCSVVMMNGASPGTMKLGSSARTRAYCAVPAEARMAWVSSNHVIATPSYTGVRPRS